MKATTTKLLTAGLAALVLVGVFTVLGAGNARAEQLPRTDPPWCQLCEPVITTQYTVCELVACNYDCQYVCRAIPYGK